MKQKVLYLNSTLPIEVKELPQVEASQSIYIEGYASTCDIDRTGDVVSIEVWKTAMDNYLKNPVILAYHDHDNPVGRMVDYRVDNKGLWVKARISAAAEVYNLVKDSVLTAFSIGFKVEDAEYDAESEIFMIKAIELVEISVVSIPCNQNTVFSLAKAFDNAEDYSIFKKQFTKATEKITVAEVESTTKKEWIMSPEEIKQMLEAATKQAAEQATKALLDKQEQEQKEKAAKQQAEDELNNRVEKAVAARVQTLDTGAERLLADVTKRIESETGNALEGLNAVIKEKAEELAKIQKSKMNFTDKADGNEVGYADRETAVLLGKITGKGIEGTNYGRNLVEKAGAHFGGTYNVNGVTATSIWETEVSLNMENEIRRRLVVAPTMRSVAMQTNVMTIPLNPEAGDATWVTNAQFGSDTSSGAAAVHTLSNITLSAFKVATREYMAYEEEEDSLIVLLPIVRDAMLRRTARSIDRAFLRGAGSGSDPVKGLAAYATAAAQTATVTTSAAVTVASLRGLRAKLGGWGLDPQELVFLVSTEAYYDLLEDTSFQAMNQVGPLATLMTGQIGQIGGTPVLVSDQFAAKATTVPTALCYNPANYIIGNQRGLRVDTQELVETQRRVLVASLRVGMTQISPNIGGVANPGVAKLSWL
jgi:HK97 family phage prohead protease/HK97 family phage major capsid protein